MSLLITGIRSFTDSLISGLLNGFVSEKAKAQIDAIYGNFWKNVAITTGLNIVMIAIVLIAKTFFTVNHIVILLIFLITAALLTRGVIRFIKTITNLIKIRQSEHFDIVLIAVRKALKQWSITAGIRSGYRAFYEKYNNKSLRIMGVLHKFISSIGLIKSPKEIESDVIRAGSMIKDYALKLIIYRVVAIAAFYGGFILILKPIIFSQTIALEWYKILAFPFTVELPAFLEFIKKSCGF
jgi:hypothetical protein